MATRRRERDGLGYSSDSWKKHAGIWTVVAAQVASLDATARGRVGVIVDMHAGTGEGVELMQMDLFRRNVSMSSPAVACRLANEAEPNANVVLCESKKDRRQMLAGSFPEALILPDNRKLLEYDFSSFHWAFIMNDPTGHSGHALEVMQDIARRIKRSDFLVLLNEASLYRHLGVATDAEPGTSSNAHLIAKVRETAESYAWMKDCRQWGRLLGKRWVARSIGRVGNRAFKGRMMLITNYVADGVRRQPRVECLEVNR